MALTFVSVDENLVCDHLNENNWSVLSCGTVWDALQGGSNLYGCRKTSVTIQINAIDQYFHQSCDIVYDVVQGVSNFRVFVD